MDLFLLLPVSAALIHIAAFVVYNIQTRLGHSDPNPVSWFLWAFLATLNAASFSTMNASALSGLQFIAGSVGCIVTSLYVLSIGKFRRPKPLEFFLLCLGIASIIAWKLSGATGANMILAVACIISFVPTALGVWHGDAEHPPAWWMWTFASVLTTINTISTRGWWGPFLIMPLVLVVTHGSIPLILWARKK